MNRRHDLRQSFFVVAFALISCTSHLVLAQPGDSQLTIRHLERKGYGFGAYDCTVELNSQELGVVGENTTKTFRCDLKPTGNLLTIRAGTENHNEVFDATVGSRVNVTFGYEDLGMEWRKVDYFPYRDGFKKTRFVKSVDVTLAKPSTIRLTVPNKGDVNVIYSSALKSVKNEVNGDKIVFIYETVNLLPESLAYADFTLQRKSSDGTVANEEEFHVPTCRDKKYEFDLSDFGGTLNVANRTSYFINAAADTLSVVNLDASLRNLGSTWKWLNEVLLYIKVSGVDPDAALLVNKISNHCVSGCELVRRIEPKEDPYIDAKVGLAQATGGVSALAMLAGEVLLEAWGATSEQQREINSFLERYRELQRQARQTLDVLSSRHQMEFADSDKLISNVTRRTKR